MKSDLPEWATTRAARFVEKLPGKVKLSFGLRTVRDLAALLVEERAKEKAACCARARLIAGHIERDKTIRKQIGPRLAALVDEFATRIDALDKEKESAAATLAPPLSPGFGATANVKRAEVEAGEREAPELVPVPPELREAAQRFVMRIERLDRELGMMRMRVANLEARERALIDTQQMPGDVMLGDVGAGLDLRASAFVEGVKRAMPGGEQPPKVRLCLAVDPHFAKVCRLHEGHAGQHWSAGHYSWDPEKPADRKQVRQVGGVKAQSRSKKRK